MTHFRLQRNLLILTLACSMASLDVKSLFTNIPLNAAIENCMNNLFYNNDTVHNLIKDDLKEFLKFASYESFFIFDNEYYHPNRWNLHWVPTRTHLRQCISL